MENIDTIIIFAILSTILFVFFLLLEHLKINRRNNLSAKIDELYSKIRKDINDSVAPTSIDILPAADDFIQFAVEIWRLEKQITKCQSSLLENQKKRLENSIQNFKRYLKKYDIEIIDYTNQKFNEGLNLDVLSYEKDPSIAESIIKETMEPTVMHKGQLVRKAKIIVLRKD
jgi:molecular chaperone GrpE (heat shock protein)